MTIECSQSVRSIIHDNRMFAERAFYYLITKEIQQHQDTEHDSIPAKHLEVMFFDVAHQEADHKHGYNKSNCHANQQDHCLRH